MKIIAYQGTKRYLLEVGLDHRGLPMGRVLDLGQGKLFPPFNIHSILARGYWEEYTGSQDILDDLLSRVVHMGRTERERNVPGL
jgi:hypothetical protein